MTNTVCFICRKPLAHCEHHNPALREVFKTPIVHIDMTQHLMPTQTWPHDGDGCEVFELPDWSA